MRREPWPSLAGERFEEWSDEESRGPETGARIWNRFGEEVRRHQPLRCAIVEQSTAEQGGDVLAAVHCCLRRLRHHDGFACHWRLP
jgi:hypothetical protein